MDETIENTGYFALFLTFFMNAWNFLAKFVTVKSINEVVVLITGILAMIYMIYKVRRERQSWKRENKD
jgi:hypothetical protein